MEAIKLLPIPDIHGRRIWKDIIEKENPDKVVFLGDYFDSTIWDAKLKMNVPYIPAMEQIDNFLEIIDYKIKAEGEGKEVVLLIGNHDSHYFSCLGDCKISGWQNTMFNSINQVVEENKHHLQMCHIHEDFLFTHAGVSTVWLEEYVGYKGEPIDEFLNDLWLHQPYHFKFNGWEESGDNMCQTPIWIRPRSLLRANVKTPIKKKYIQIVGHTAVYNIDIKGKITGGRYYFVDTFRNDIKEYLTIKNKIITLNSIT